MKISKIYKATIDDNADTGWQPLTMYVVFADDASMLPEENDEKYIARAEAALKPYGLDDDDIHFYFDTEDLATVKDNYITDGSYDITLLEEVERDVA